MGSNANGILKKQESLKSLINQFKPSAITIQEAKIGRPALMKLKGYQIFEKVRTGNQGGGLITAIDEDLEPVLVSTGEDEETELITVQVKVGERNVRIINANRPQEENQPQKISDFW